MHLLQTAHHVLHAARRVAIAAAMPLAAAGAEPLKLPACEQALAALQQQESAALAAQRPASTSAAARRAAVDAVQARQRLAAVACRLQTDPPSLPPASRLREPLRVGPAVGPPTALSRLPAPATSTPAGVGPQTVNLGACDEQGCWTTDGRRLLRAGPWLIGPGGYCSQQGTVLRCP